MKTIITIPILFSKTVPDRLIPLLCKLEERNIAVNYRKVFEDALIKNIKRWYGLKKTFYDNYNPEFRLLSSDLLLEASSIEDINRELSRINDYIEARQRDIDKENTNTNPDPTKIRMLEDEIKQLKDRKKDLQSDRESIKAEREYQAKMADVETKAEKNIIDARKAAEERERVEREKMEKRTKIDSSSATSKFSSADSIEIPAGVVLYKDISLEPTIIEITIDERKYFIGLKSIPYQIDNDANIIINMMKDAQGGVINTTKRLLKRYWNSIVRHSFGRAGYIYKGRPVQGNALTQAINAVLGGKNMGDSPLDDLYFSPSVYDLTNPSRMAKIIDSHSPVWSTILCTTTTDVEEAGVDLEYFYKIYRRATKVGWGDLLFIDREQEMVSHCSMSLLSCTKISFSSLQKLFNLENVIDFSQLSRYAKGPFSANTMPIKSFMKKGF